MTAASRTSHSHCNRYWSHSALGCLHRTLAIQEWLGLKYGEDTADATERSFAALDMFILDERPDGDIDDAKPPSQPLQHRSSNHV
jgi:hypothetical protein